MGIGDELMAAGRAEQAHKSSLGLPIGIVDRRMQFRWHPLWQHNPFILQPGDRHLPCQYLVDAPGARPYIERYDPHFDRFHWRDCKPHPATIVLTDDEDAFGRQYAGAVIYEDGLKPEAPRTKMYNQWPALHELLADLPLLHLASLNRSIRHAAAVMKYAKAYVGHEGALHHMAAAFRVPAVVIMGHYVGTAQTGYDLPNHVYLVSPEPPCGNRRECSACERTMRGITPTKVNAELRALLA